MDCHPEAIFVRKLATTLQPSIISRIKIKNKSNSIKRYFIIVLIDKIKVDDQAHYSYLPKPTFTIIQE